ncbi:MAG TPA: hypothetical protein VMW88_04895 [Thermoplasmata archaeon]|jgi:hypothetical protein|nr:hypothetical protein [Thermoplasmata archaeon]HUU07729.1 hypothetical protein [Thermoplasmata archaeon]
MFAADIQRIIDESARKLLQSSSPSVRYWVLRDVMQKGEEDSDLQRTLAECEHYPARQRLIRTMKVDGSWPVPRFQQPPTGVTTPTRLDPVKIAAYKNLLSLLHFVTRPDEDGIMTATNRLLDDQSEEGYLRGPIEHGLPQPHFDGYALYILYGFDMAPDARVKKAADWLISNQRRDGGWSMPYVQDVRYLDEYRHLKMEDFVRLMMTDERDRHDPRELQHIPSCHWTTMMILWGLGEVPSRRNSRCIRRATDFLLGRFFKKNPHSNYYMSERNWMTVRYPFSKCGGLSALNTLTKMGKGPDDPRMEKPIRWLVSQRYRDGFWTESNRPHMEKGQWITLSSLEILSRYAAKL